MRRERSLFFIARALHERIDLRVPSQIQSHAAPSSHRSDAVPFHSRYVLGAGVYALAGTIAGEVGGAIWVPLLVALFFAMLTASSYAELVTKYPHAGAASVFAEKAFKSPMITFLVGFSMLAAAVTSAAGLSLAFAGDYLTALIDVPPSVAALVFLADHGGPCLHGGRRRRVCGIADGKVDGNVGAAA